MSTILASLVFLLALVAQRVPVMEVAAEPVAAPVLTVRGQVFEARELPAARVSVTVGLHRFREIQCAVDTITDEEGRFSVDVPLATEVTVGGDPRPRRYLQAYACVNRTGFMRTSHARAVPAEVDALNLGSLLLREGTTMRLRVLDRDGEALSAGSVSIESFDGDPLPHESGLLRFGGGRARCVRAIGTRDAHYDVHFPPGKSASLLVRSPGRGTAWLPDVTPGTDDEITARLVGAGRLAGELVDPAGTPLAGVKLAAYPVELLEALDPAQEAWRIRNVRETAGGLFTDTRTTDADGRFVFDGLQPGSYFLQQASSRTSGSIERAPLPTGTTTRIVLALYRIELKVTKPVELDLEGDPFCARISGQERIVDLGQGRTPRGKEEDLCWTWDVDPEARYAVGWKGGGLELERVVEVRTGAFVTPVELDLGDRPAPAQLTLAFEQELGGPYRFEPSEELRIKLSSARTGVCLFWKDVRSVTTELTVAPGEYEVEAEPMHEVMMCGYGQRPRSRLWRGPARATLRLAPGEERTLALAPSSCGRVRVHLELPSVVRDPRLRGDLSDPDARMDLLGSGGGPGATVSEVIEGEEPHALDLYIVDTGNAGGAFSRMLPGTSAVTASVLRPGPRTLRIEAPGFEPETVTVVVVAGEVVDARVQLRDRD